MDWNDIAPDFVPEKGILREIHVLDPEPFDWQRIYEHLRNWSPRPIYLVDGEITELPNRIEDIFLTGEAHSPLLRFLIDRAHLHCHFFRNDRIEFNVDPADVTDIAQVEALSDFMALLGKVTGKQVVLSMEGGRDRAVILRYSPETAQVEWVPPQH